MRIDKYENEIYTCEETGWISDDPKEIPQCNVCGTRKLIEHGGVVLMRYCEYGHHVCLACAVEMPGWFFLCKGECESKSIKEAAEQMEGVAA